MEKNDAISRAREVLGRSGQTKFVQRVQRIEFRTEYRKLMQWVAAVRDQQVLMPEEIESAIANETARLNRLRETGPYWLIRFSNAVTSGALTSGTTIQVRVYEESGRVEIANNEPSNSEYDSTESQDFA